VKLLIEVDISLGIVWVDGVEREAWTAEVATRLDGRYSRATGIVAQEQDAKRFVGERLRAIAQALEER
jgi:hypothetical protein